MPYAINATNDGWRTIASEADLLAGEIYSAEQPVLVPTLAQVQAAQIAVLASAYQAAITELVNFKTAAGVTKAYQAGASSVGNLESSLLGLQGAQETPAGFYWVSADNTQVPFTYADLQGLAAAILASGWAAFANLQAKKAAVLAATTVTAAQAIAF